MRARDSTGGYSSGEVDELATRLFFDGVASPRTAQAYSTSTICRILRVKGYTRKKLRDLSRARNRELMNLFMEVTQAYKAEELLVLDETKRDDRHLKRRYGRSRGRAPPLSFDLKFQGVYKKHSRPAAVPFLGAKFDT